MILKLSSNLHYFAAAYFEVGAIDRFDSIRYLKSDIDLLLCFVLTCSNRSIQSVNKSRVEVFSEP